MSYLLVDRVARAMVVSRPIPEGHVLGDVDWDTFRSMAAAALEATALNIEVAHGELHPGAVYIRAALAKWHPHSP